MENKINLNDIEYTFKESFDVNLLLTYENDKWGAWEIVREFVSNALDSVNNDINMIDIRKMENNYIIHDKGQGYPIFYAKRIGASSKKNNYESIGQFGEGTKLAILTCVRNKISIMIGSENWLIVPYSKIVEGQEVLFYDIYESEEHITGSIVYLEANTSINEIFNHLDNYFLAYSNTSPLHGNMKSGIYSQENGSCKLYNKGVYIKDIEALYSYAISIDDINRDRNIISNNDLAYKIRDIYMYVADENIIKSILLASSQSYDNKKKLIEFQFSFYSHYPDAWKNAFINVYGLNALIGTNDIAAREAESLGYNPINNLDYSICRILKDAGIKEDINCLSDDYEFVWAETLTKDQVETLEKLPQLTEIAGFEDLPKTIKVFSEYKNHPNVNGCYNHEKKEIYLKQDILDQGFEKVIKTYLHECTHHATGCDDLDRFFADTLCIKLTELLLKYKAEVGIEGTIHISNNSIKLPENIKLSAKDLNAYIFTFDDDLLITAGKSAIKIKLQDCIPPTLLKKRVSIKNGKFIVSLPNNISNLLVLNSENSLKCTILIKE